ncbi:putative inactive receptor kinase [Iris pallida]|uniref:Inactive receptor kinase n=1 Tax=Iris pallida TaxID=29817 RepID=A0AAX6DMX8_IRIPA|nr:putative inactive receptor kinase [Iris pallida]
MLLLLLLLPTLSLLLLSTTLSQPDLNSLLEFKKGIASDPSGLVAGSWTLAGPSCPKSWHGVTCGPDGAAVVALSLDGLGLSGDLKLSTLAPLASLQTLTLSGNNLTGRLVPALGSLSSLRRLDLSANRFYGPVPAKIARLQNLVHLNLSHNSLAGGFPVGIRSLRQLRVLDLRSNALWGDAEDLLSGCGSLEHVDLSDNRFSGRLSFGSGLADAAKYLNLSGNDISGGFGSMGSFRNLEVLDVGRNRLSGELPEFGGLTNFRVLRAGSNLLDGPVPGGLLQSGMQLAEIDLSGNGFTGSLPSINSTTLKVLNLSSNALSGPLPSSIGNCISVDLSKNMVSGDLSVMRDWGDALENIDLSSNLLTGNYPNLASQFGNLISIKLQNNSIEGYLPSVIGTYPRLLIMDFSLNKLSGPILPNLLTSITLTTLNLSGNQLSGIIPIQSSHSTELLVLDSYPHLESVDLSHNFLSGPLPLEIGNLRRLRLINLEDNDLSGELPNELSKLGELEVVDLSMNHFSNSIPDMLQAGLKVFNVSYNDLSGTVPEHLRMFPRTTFYPGNTLLTFPGSALTGKGNNVGIVDMSQHQQSKGRIRVAYILGSIGVILLIFIISMAVYKVRSQEFCGRNRSRDHHINGKDVKLGTAMSLSNDYLLTSVSRTMSAQKELLTETVEYAFPNSKEGISESVKVDESNCSPRKSSLEQQLSSSPHFIYSLAVEQPVMMDVYSPYRLVGELFFLDSSLVFTAEELSRAPAAVLGSSSHGTSYKATLDSGNVLTVKWLQVGLVKHKKEFAKEAKRIGTLRHPNITPWRGYYWGPRKQERLIVADYVSGHSLALYLYESTPRRYSRLSVSQRLKIAMDVARCLHYLHHDRALPHGNLKPTNILLTCPNLDARVTDYGLHRLLTPSGIAEQILNLGALGYRAPELAEATKPLPSFKADVYAFGVILMELLTRRSAGDIISGQSGAVDLTDWVQLCTREGRGTDCFDREIAGLEEAPSAMDQLLAVSLRCILPLNERPNISSVLDDLCAIKT